MSVSRLIERIGRTNAYPSDQPLPPGWLGDLLEAEAQGRDIMSTIQKQRPAEPKATTRSTNRWRIAIAAIAVVVVAIATVIFLTSEGSDVVEPPTTTVPADPEAAARIEAAGGGVSAFYSLDAGQLTDAMDGQSPLDAFQRSARVLNTTTVDQPICSFSGQNQIQCQATTEDDFTKAFGYQQQETLTLTFRDSDIIASRWFGEHPAYVDPFWTWVFEVHCQRRLHRTGGALTIAQGEWRRPGHRTGPSLRPTAVSTLPPMEYGAIALFGFVASVTPGPNNVMLWASGLNYGFRRTIPHLAGINIGFVSLLLATSFGLGALFQRWVVS